MLAERAIFGIEIFLPERRRLDDMAVAIEYREVFGRHLRPPLAPVDRRLWFERGADFFFGRPPAGALDLGDPVADDRRRRLHLVEAASIRAEELGLVLLRQIVFLHRLDRPPRV